MLHGLSLCQRCASYLFQLHRTLPKATVKRSLSSQPVDMLANNSYIPRRAVLYVPGSDMKKLNKIQSLKADCIVLDCEDGVAYNMKDVARQNIGKMLGIIEFGIADCTVRVNSVSSGIIEDDLKAVLKASRLPQTVILPKVDYVQEIEEFTAMLEDICFQYKIESWKPALITCVETSIGLLNLQGVLQRAKELSQTGCRYRLDGVLFGSDDFCADIGAIRSKTGMEVFYARQKVVTTAKAYRLQVIDMVDIDFHDLDALKKTSIEGAGMGFTGKQVIHPAQVPVVQVAFSPSLEKVAWATDLIRQFEDHVAAGKGAFTYHGQMIDMPLLLQAKNIINMSKIVAQK
ncbi:CLYBL [Acanthosepion pharaonis]|uniref:Citramalyl-CoA lyase, mitochondrial n=1 Tax=Acanthosepion pharaonis TaxID=158019 RepID=A0A812D5Q2_ACAPH|nr:CLYBL [Sepia pharaonis]